MEFHLLLLQTLNFYRAIFGDILSQSHSQNSKAISILINHYA